MNDIPELPTLHPLRRPVPEGGLEAAVAAGRRRLWVRGTTATTSVALVLAAFTLFQPAESRQDSLIANDPSPEVTTPTQDPPPEPTAQPAPEPGNPDSDPSIAADPSAGDAASPKPAPAGAPKASGESVSPAQPGPGAPQRPGFREQTDEDAPRPAACRSAPGVASCVYTDDSGAVVRRGEETRAVVGECTTNDTLGPTRYGFDTGQETELVVTLQGREVFRFSSTVTYLDGAHERILESGKCIQWTNAWRGTTTAGDPVPAGTYQVTLTVMIDSVRTEGAPPPDPSSEPYTGNSHRYDVTIID